MNFVKKYAILVFVMLLYVSLANAAAFDIEITPIEDRISIEEFAKFEVKVKNNLQIPDVYRIYSANFPTWDVRTEPIVNPITIELNPGEEGKVEIIVDPLKIRDIGTYAVSLNVRSNALNRLSTVPLEVTILSTETLIGGYVPTVITSLGIPDKIDPREEVPIKIVLSNQNIIDYPDLVIKLESDLFEDTIDTKLGPKEDKTLDLTTILNPLTPPQKIDFVLSVFKADRSIINPIVRKIEIIEYQEQILVDERKRLLTTRRNYEFISNNPDYEGTFKVETTLFGSIFSSESPKAKIITENDKKYFVWDVKLENNKMQVTVTKNFVPMFIVIVALIVIASLYYTLRAPLSLRKEYSSKIIKHGGVVELSIVLHIKNRGQGKIKDIEITEIIPSIISVGKEVSIGSLRPTKILRHEKKGTTIVKWNIDNLDVSEERVVSYKVTSKLSILGSFSLAAATAVFKYNGKTYTAASNRLSVDE